MKTVLITLALAASAAAPGPIVAQSRSTVVSTAGLDLGRVADQRTLELRLIHAASELCGTPSSSDARGHIKREQCRTEARASAAHQVRLLAERAVAVAVAAR